jgi:hypothetical protein
LRDKRDKKRRAFSTPAVFLWCAQHGRLLRVKVITTSEVKRNCSKKLAAALQGCRSNSIGKGFASSMGLRPGLQAGSQAPHRPKFQTGVSFTMKTPAIVIKKKINPAV